MTINLFRQPKVASQFVWQKKLSFALILILLAMQLGSNPIFANQNFSPKFRQAYLSPNIFAGLGYSFVIRGGELNLGYNDLFFSLRYITHKGLPFFSSPVKQGQEYAFLVGKELLTYDFFESELVFYASAGIGYEKGIEPGAFLFEENEVGFHEPISYATMVIPWNIGVKLSNEILVLSGKLIGNVPLKNREGSYGLVLGLGIQI